MLQHPLPKTMWSHLHKQCILSLPKRIALVLSYYKALSPQNGNGDGLIEHDSKYWYKY